MSYKYKAITDNNDLLDNKVYIQLSNKVNTNYIGTAEKGKDLLLFNLNKSLISDISYRISTSGYIEKSGKKVRFIKKSLRNNKYLIIKLVGTSMNSELLYI